MLEKDIRSFLSIALALIILALTGEGQHLCLAQEGNGCSIRIASIFAKSGSGAEENSFNYAVLKLAAKVLNQSGGVIGKRIELIEFDTHSTSIGARKAALDATRAGVVAVIGPSWSSQAMAMATVLQKAGIPMIGTTTTAPEVTLVGDYIFRVCYTDIQQANVLAHFAREHLKARTGAVVTIAGDVYSEGLSAEFIRCFTAQGGNILVQVRYLQSAMDFAKQVEAVQAVLPDFVFLPGYARDSGLFLKQARDRGLSMSFLGGDGWTGLENYTHLNPAQGDNYYVSHWHPKSGTEASQVFVSLLVKEYGDKATRMIDGGNANVFDALGLVVDAIKRAGSAEPVAIRDALAQTVNYSGITGEISFKGSRDPVKPLVVLKMSPTGVVYVRTMEPGS